MNLENRKKAPMASAEAKAFYMKLATREVLDGTIVEDSATILADTVKLPREYAHDVVGLITYMAIFAIAEKEANEEGYTLMDWSKQP